MIDCISQSQLLNLRVDRSRMVHSPTGSSDLFMILGFSTLYSSPLWRTDTIVFAKLHKLPLPSSVFEINKPPWGLSRGFQTKLFASQ